jgi:hypothetical protein
MIQNEKDWLAADDTDVLLAFLRGRVSERKVRLFAVACCRLVWHLLPEGPYRRAVEVAEAYAEGKATKKALTRAHKEARAQDTFDAEQDNNDTSDAEIDASAATLTTSDPKDIFDSVLTTVSNVTVALSEDAIPEVSPARDRELGRADASLADLLREIVGNPFRPVVINPQWLTSNDGVVRNLATAIDTEQAFDRLPILADALEDAGCDNIELLAHLRSPGPHVRGCWALDQLLGRE